MGSRFPIRYLVCVCDLYVSIIPYNLGKSRAILFPCQFFLERVNILDKNSALQPLSELQLKEQFDTIVEFLSAVHPTLLLQEGYKPCIEIRPILRSEKKEYILNRSLNLWDLSDASLKRLMSFLDRHNGKPTCIYYSVFSFDNNMDAVTAQGKKAKTGKITKMSALNTDEIALDFDKIGYNEFIEIKERFEAMGIYAIWVFSGHGYQAHILLDKSLSDKNMLKRAVYKFRSKGFDCDEACIDPARVMRLPGTFNCKCLTDAAMTKSNPRTVPSYLRVQPDILWIQFSTSWTVFPM